MVITVVVITVCVLYVGILLGWHAAFVFLERRPPPLGCFFGKHQTRGPHNIIGLDPKKPGWVDFYCSACQRRISRQPLAEITDPKTLMIVEDLLQEGFRNE